MSRTIKKEITCPACGEKADAKMWASVNVTLDQELRESVLDESLFTWTCPQCGHERCSVTLVYITIWPINL